MLVIEKETKKVGYKSFLGKRETEEAIHFIKSYFSDKLAKELHLFKTTAPLFVRVGTGINDDLNGVESPVSFTVKSDSRSSAVIVHSLAKWKRMALARYGCKPGEGIYTDMRAIRADEELDPIHSLYVDQWDWERVLTKEERSIEFLKMIVRKIYRSIKSVEREVERLYPHIISMLPDDIHFIHSEELESMYPGLSPKEREHEICKKHGAVFIIGIGGSLPIGGMPHDGRASDYDDWSTQTYKGFKGLNGDILVWNPVLSIAFELSSMGIRVDKDALEYQLKICGHEDRKKLLFHSMLFSDELPLSIGGGIGQSRLCMYLLRKAHIGEVQASVWPERMIEDCASKNIWLL